MEGIAVERPGWHSLRRNGLAAGHGEATGIGIHVTSPLAAQNASVPTGETSRDYADPDAVARRPDPEWRVQILGHYFGRRLTDWMETLGFA